MNYTKLQNCVVEIWSSPLYTFTIYIVLSAAHYVTHPCVHPQCPTSAPLGYAVQTEQQQQQQQTVGATHKYFTVYSFYFFCDV